GENCRILGIFSNAERSRRLNRTRCTIELVADLEKCNKELKHRQRQEAGACPVLEEVVTKLEFQFFMFRAVPISSLLWSASRKYSYRNRCGQTLKEFLSTVT